MKRVFSGIILLAITFSFLSMTKCERQPNEIGSNSLVYFKNGEKILPECDSLSLYITRNHDTLGVNICFNGSDYLNFTINNYQTEGVYYFNNNSDNICQLVLHQHTPQGAIYNSANNHKTYLRIIELNNDYIIGTFEADLFSQTYPYNPIIITKGRFDYLTH